jgi:hypothetical protein
MFVSDFAHSSRMPFALPRRPMLNLPRSPPEAV